MIDALGAQRTLEVVTEPDPENGNRASKPAKNAESSQEPDAADGDDEPFFGKAESLPRGCALGLVRVCNGYNVHIPARVRIECAGGRI